MRSLVLKLLGASPNGMPPTTLAKIITRHRPELSNRAIRTAIRSLVDHGEVIFSNRYGRTHLELNFHRCVRISERMIITSSRITPPEGSASLIIKINSGASFGMGDHPSTRAALRGVEFALPKAISSKNGRPIAVLDIGTGSGIQAIAAVKLGASTAVGLDTDPVARHEAKMNVGLNRLDHAVTIQDGDLDQLPADAFDVLIANLRTPTLIQMIPAIRRASRWSAYWIFAGFRDTETAGLIDAVSDENGEQIRRFSECGWCAIVFRLEKQIPGRSK